MIIIQTKNMDSFAPYYAKTVRRPRVSEPFEMVSKARDKSQRKKRCHVNNVYIYVYIKKSQV